MIYGNEPFSFAPADFYPFKNIDEINRVRAITREDISAMNGKHPTSPTMSIEVIKNEEFETIMLTDMLKRIIDSDRYDKKCVMIMCNPCPSKCIVNIKLNRRILRSGPSVLCGVSAS